MAAVASLASSALFGSAAPARFTLRRSPDGDLAKAADQLARRVRGAEVSDTITLVDDNMRMLGTIFIPETVKRVRVVVVVFRWGSGSLVYADEAIRSGLVQPNQAGRRLRWIVGVRNVVGHLPGSRQQFRRSNDCINQPPFGGLDCVHPSAG